MRAFALINHLVVVFQELLDAIAQSSGTAAAAAAVDAIAASAAASAALDALQRAPRSVNEHDDKLAVSSLVKRVTQVMRLRGHRLAVTCIMCVLTRVNFVSRSLKRPFWIESLR
jgi:hypothetical protein